MLTFYKFIKYIENLTYKPKNVGTITNSEIDFISPANHIVYTLLVCN
ncbi:hypothetical protein LEP1GSC041_0197 [Leptospira noguchii str. 2006001870]|nr:hypothetical protein LEP1GSC041_0197 [Leptospira noguchii str. 2006001870]